MLSQAACTASCYFILITLAATVGISQTLDLVLAERKEVRGLPWCLCGCTRLSLYCLSRCWSLFVVFCAFKLRFAQESYMVGSDAGR